jgi:hypothetical protein
MAAVTVGSIRRPNRRPDVRTQLAAALLTLAGQVTPYRVDADSPCCPTEWLARHPFRPGRLACSGCGNDPGRTR